MVEGGSSYLRSIPERLKMYSANENLEICFPRIFTEASIIFLIRGLREKDIQSDKKSKAMINPEG